MGPTKEADREPLRDPAGNLQVFVTEEDVAGVGSEAHNEPIDTDEDGPDDEPDPSDHAQVDHDAWSEP